MRAAVSKCVNGITLLGIGGVLLAFWVNHRVDQYLHPQFRPGILVAGILLVVAGTIYCLSKGPRRCRIAGECVHEANESPARSFMAFGVLLVPLVAGSLVSKDAFDQTAVLNRNIVQDASILAGRAAIQVSDPNAAGAGDTAESDRYLPRGADGNVTLEVTDLLYGEAEPSLRQVFTGKTVEIIGQYLPSQEAAHFKLVRMLIVCCAADARPMMVNVELDRPVQQSDLAWVKVIGKPSYQEANGKVRVTLKATEVMPVDPPADAMLY